MINRENDPTGDRPMPIADRPRGPLSDAEAAAFGRQVAGLAGAGLPMEAGLRALGEEMPDSRLRAAFAELAGRVEAGEPLDEAIAACGQRFPAHLRGLVRAGARSNRLGRVLERFARIEATAADLRRGLWLNLAHPMLLLIAMIIIYMFASYTVVADMHRIYADFGIEIPRATRLVLETSRRLNEPGVVQFLIASAAVLGGMLLLGLISGPRGGRWMLRHLPMIGAVARWTALAEFAHLLGLLVDGEVPLPEALRLAGEAGRDPQMARAAGRVAAEVDGGRTLADALLVARAFPPGLVGALAWAEEHRALPETLELIGDLFEARARSQSSFVGTFLGTLTFFLVVGGVGFGAAALLVPMITLINKLSG